MKRSSILVLFFSLTLAACASNENENPVEQSSEAAYKNAAYQFINSAKIGWNFGNQFDAYTNGISSETAWGNPPATQKMFDLIAKSGFGIVRIPVTWNGHIGSATSDYKIEESWLSRLATVIGYAKKAGLKVIINMHHDDNNNGGWLSIKKASSDKNTLDSLTVKFKKVWTQVAQYFGNEGNYLMFEAMNEVQDGGWGWGLASDTNQFDIINLWNQTFVDAVRSTGGQNSQRFLGIACYSASPRLASHLKIPTDTQTDRLLLSVHCYDPFDYAGEAKYHEWGHNAKNKAASGNEEDWKTIVKSLYENFVKKGVPVYFGEYGAVRQDGYESFRLYYMEYITKLIHDYEMLPVYWDNGANGSGKDKFGLYNRSNYSYSTGAESVVKVMMKAAGVTKSDKNYSLEQIYKAAPASK